MIGNVERGNGFRGCLDYLLEKKEAELIHGNMTGLTPRELAHEFGLVRQLNPRSKNPCWHASLSAHPEERLFNDEWSALAERYLELMGVECDKHQYIVVRHHDTDHQHVHIVLNRIDLDGKLNYMKWERNRNKQATRQLEREFNLRLTEEKRKLNIDRGTLEWMERTGERPPSLRQLEQEGLEVVAPAGVAVLEYLQRTQTQEDDALLEMQGDQLILTHNERGEIFRAKVKPNQQGQQEYSPLVSRLSQSDIERWTAVKLTLEKDKQTRQLLTQFSDLELLSAPKAVAAYFAAEPPKPPLDSEQGHRAEIDRLKAERDRLTNAYIQKLDQMEKVSNLMLLLPPVSKRFDENMTQAEKIWATKNQVEASLKQANANLEQWHQQVKAHQDWVANPQTQAMRQLAAFLDLPQVHSRLEALKQEQQRQLATEQIQQEGRATAQAVQDMFSLIKSPKRSDGSQILDGTNWRLEQLGNTVSVTVKADNRQILRVEGGKTVVFNPTPDEREKMNGFREKVKSDLQQEQQRQREAKLKSQQSQQSKQSNERGHGIGR